MEEKNNNPNNLIQDKSYWFKYRHCPSKWFKATITRFTTDGHPWADGGGHSGIISPGSYEIIECTPTKELEEQARAWLNKKGYLGFAEHTPVPLWMVEFAVELEPNILKTTI